jgi:adenosylmethionine-8-amino-7-oxononanoate aminotransferase
MITSGYVPLSAVLVSEQIADVLVASSATRNAVLGHGFTYTVRATRNAHALASDWTRESAAGARVALLRPRAVGSRARPRAPACAPRAAQGHPLATAVALKTLDILERDGLMARGKEEHPVGNAFNSRLREAGKHALVGEARGVGLVGAVELVARKSTGAVPKAGAGKLGPMCAAEALERGLIVRAIGDSIALCPPLVISEAETHELFDKLHAALDATERKARANGLLDAD